MNKAGSPIWEQNMGQAALSGVPQNTGPSDCMPPSQLFMSPW